MSSDAQMIQELLQKAREGSIEAEEKLVHLIRQGSADAEDAIAGLLYDRARAGSPEAEDMLFNFVRQGSSKAEDALVSLFYNRFREGARRQRRHERPSHSFWATELTHEAWIRLKVGGEFAKAANRNQLFRAFARAMRQALIDHARRRNADKRVGGRQREELDDVLDMLQQRSGRDVLSLDESLNALAAEHPQAAEALDMKFFGGYELKEIALALGVSESTVGRDVRLGLAWLRTRLDSEGRP